MPVSFVFSAEAMEHLKTGNGGRRYSVGSLCRLRVTLPVVACMLSRINKHPDIGGFPLSPDLISSLTFTYSPFFTTFKTNLIFAI